MNICRGSAICYLLHWTQAGPRRAEPSKAEPSRAEPSRAEPSRAEPHERYGSK